MAFPVLTLPSSEMGDKITGPGGAQVMEKALKTKQRTRDSWFAAEAFEHKRGVSKSYFGRDVPREYSRKEGVSNLRK